MLSVERFFLWHAAPITVSFIPALASIALTASVLVLSQETAAAIKVQSIVRRNQTMSRLEAEGITTAAIRNRSRKRQARMGSSGVSGSADIPGLFACCGVGLAFGDSTEENYQTSRQHEKDHYLEVKKEREAKEEELRANFKKLEAKRKAARRTDVEEIIEVVDE
jgi:hypothetical protein